MNYHYEICKTNEASPGLAAHIGYGLICCREQKVLAEFRDISPDRRAVEALAALFEREQPEPVHLEDILSDMLAEGLI